MTINKNNYVPLDHQGKKLDKFQEILDATKTKLREEKLELKNQAKKIKEK